MKITDVEMSQHPSGACTFGFRTLAHNGGATPGYNCNHFGFLAPMTKKEAADKLGKVRPIDRAGQIGGSKIHSGEDFPTIMHNRATLDASVIGALQSGALTLYAFGVTSYEDTFGRKRRTDFCHFLEPDDFRTSLAASRQSPGEKIPVEWIIAPFHNSAT